MKLLQMLGLGLAALSLVACARVSDIYTFEIFEEPSTSRPPPPSSGSTEVSDDGRTIWIKPGVEATERETDVSDCYSYAQAQVAHDMRIQGDVSAAGTSAGIGGEESAFMGRMDTYELGSQRETLFRRCMRAKGYSRG